MSDLSQRLAQLTPEQRARLADRVAADRVAADRVAADRVAADRVSARDAELPVHGIAIVGMGCRLPGGANSPAALWDLLVRGVDAVTPVPSDRWDADAFFDGDYDAPAKIATRDAAFINGVGDFDPAFFGISPFEARQMDPQQRLFLEVASEALERAGLTRSQLAGSMCGVFVGVHSHSSEYYAMQAADLATIDTYTSTGTAHSVIANRLSYVLDLRGPSMAIDTACSSSLVALHQACLSLRAGDSDVAIAGGLNLILTPEFNVALSKLRVLSTGGRCRTFDAAADGIARGEGCAVVVLKRVGDALRDGDPVLAIIRGTAVNQDGATNGLTAPSTPSQIAVIRSALATAKLDPSQIGFVETHGTGTSLGDPIEVEAIAATYGAPRANGDEVVLGALKTNLGHLEGAAGLASVIKTVLCLQHRHIPQNLHFTTLNPHIQLDGTSIVLATAAREWTPRSGTRVGAVSSFGFGGTNAHAIIEESFAERPVAETAESCLRPLVLSAQTEPALSMQIDRWRDALRTTLASAEARDLAYTATMRRTHYACRAVVIGSNASAWADQLEARSRVRAAGLDDRLLAPLAAGERRKVAFVFCGQGSQWFAMGRELAAAEPVFREVLVRVSEIVERTAGWSLLDELSRDEASSRVYETAITQPALFAIQMGLVALWRAWGVEPDFVIGHSMGEIAAACTAGAIDFAEGARIAILRGRAVAQAEGQGAMIAFPISTEAATRAIAGLEQQVGIAAINAPASVVIAGDAVAVSTVAATLRADGVEGRVLEVRYGSHSPLMAPMVAWLREALGSVSHRSPSVPMFSTISHQLVTQPTLDAAHWSSGLRRPVDFAGGVQAALDAGCRAFIDVAPHPVLGSAVRECAEQVGLDVVAVASLRRGRAEREQMLLAAGELFEVGVEMQWDALLGAGGRVAELPTYPWQHERYWITGGRHERVVPTPALTPVAELHLLAWRAAAPTAPSAATPAAPRTPAWVVLGGEPVFAAQLAAALASDGVAVRHVSGEESAAAIDAVRMLDGDLIDLRATVPTPTLGLLDRSIAVAEALRALLTATSAGPTSTARAARVWVVTCGAQRIAGETPDAAQAAAWGVGRVAAVEMPDSFGGLVDLDPAADVAQRIADLVAALAPTPLSLAECEVAYRAGGRYVPRLEAANVAASMPTFHADGYYVVTGGLGGVGLVVAAWLAERGARRLVLIGRTPLPSRDRWDDAQLTMEQQRRIVGVRRVEAYGAEVCIGVLEVSDARSVGTLVDERRRDGWGNARGIVHCATDVQFGLLHDASRDDVAAMMRAKIGGADVLLSAFDADAPDFYVMFSSLGALLGDRGQGTYAAANAVLDSWAIAQRGQGRPVSVVNWGAWEGTGLAATRGGELVVDTLQRRGVRAVPPRCATTALGAVLSTGMPQAVVFRRGGHVTKETGRDPWRALVGVSGEPEPIAAEVAPSSTAAIRELVGSRERLRKLTAVVREIVADTLGLADTPIDGDRPLGTLGMDSLMAIRIRRRCERQFELSLPATALFSYPTLGALSGLLFERLALSDELTLAPVIPDVAPTADPAAAHALSDADALAALRGRRPSRRSST